MSRPSLLTSERLRELLHYDPETGVFTRLVQTTVAVKVGDVAGSLHSTGYIYIGLCGQKYCAHRLAWLYMYGTLPSGVTDHINGIRSDNRISNLRDASAYVNAQNVRSAKSTSFTGVLGVTKPGKKWKAQIRRNGRQICIGNFATMEQAKAAYIEAKRMYHEGCTI